MSTRNERLADTFRSLDRMLEGVDVTKADEYVVLVDAKGAEHACEVVYSDLANVKAKLAVAAPAGEYTLKVYTRSGLGDAFGVKVASRKVTVG